MTLRDQVIRIGEQWERIAIRAQVDGKWGSHYLHELPEEVVAKWISDLMLSRRGC